jgi:predicted alpha/beta hydrolase family esterase
MKETIDLQQITKKKKPSVFLHLTESFRAIYETVRGIFFLIKTPKSDLGQGQVVIVVPGLLSSNFATKILRKYLNKIGFKAFGWQSGINLGRLESLAVIIKQVENTTNQYNQKVILIGWSMGGIFVREVAKDQPHHIKKVVTIGSPFADVNAPNHAKWAYNLFNKASTIDQNIVNQIHLPAPVQTIALYSKMDGMVPWEACMELEEDEMHKNIEISSSHFGMGANPNVLKVVAENLV